MPLTPPPHPVPCAVRVLPPRLLRLLSIQLVSASHNDSTRCSVLFEAGKQPGFGYWK